MDIVRSLKKVGNIVEGISSDLEQKEREDVLMRFRSRRTRVLVATDVLSRGIDIKDINLIINYDVPGSAEDYVHRVGRTARADKTGIAISFINEMDMEKFDRIEKLIGSEVIKLPVPPELGVGEGPEYKVSVRRSGKRPQGKRKYSSDKRSAGRKPDRDR